MTPGIEHFKALLSNFARDTYHLLAQEKARGPNHDIVTIYWQPIQENPIFIYSRHFAALTNSAHRQLAKEKFKADGRVVVAAIREYIIATLPGLDTPDLRFSVSVCPPTKTGLARFRVEFCSETLTSTPVTLPTIIKKVEALTRNLAGVKKPGTRRFIIGGKTLQAHDTQDAMRIYLALGLPGIFDNPQMAYPQLTISESLDANPLIKAALTQAKCLSPA